MFKKTAIYIITSTFILASCGGGGGGGGSAPVAPSNPAPTVNFSASSSEVATGTTVTLTFSSSNATSCSASGSSDWTGDKGTSGSGDVKIVYGTNTFSLSCTGSGGSSSKSVTVQGTQIFDESAFVPLGETKRYKGFVFNKVDGSVGCFASIEMDLTNNDNFLTISEFRSNEWRYIRYDYDSDTGTYTSGLRLSKDYSAQEGDEPGTFYRARLVDSALIGIDVTDVNANPYGADSTVDLESQSADIFLETDYENGLYCMPNMEMGLLALNNSSATEQDSAFIGTSESSDGYTFLYIVSKEHWDEYSDNQPSEADIFNTNWLDVDLFTSYRSNPTITQNAAGFRVKTSLVEGVNNASLTEGLTAIGSRYTDSIDTSDNSILVSNRYITKYLFEGDDNWSTQRIFLKATLGNDCLTYSSYLKNCSIYDFNIFFLTPDKEDLIGFKMGGYNGTSETTNAKIILNNDDG
ncbi:hypothetical protein OAU23_01500 [Gammaproteobacteria bacterium]|nr:hypothetical protein [Gammaproteobacteria bacterium]